MKNSELLKKNLIKNIGILALIYYEDTGKVLKSIDFDFSFNNQYEPQFKINLKESEYARRTNNPN